MNPDEIARQALIARLNGTPMAPTTQIGPNAQVPQTSPVVPAQNPMPVGDKQLGDKTPERQASNEDKLAKNILPGTAHQDPHIQALSKVLLEKLIPYLGH